MNTQLALELTGAAFGVLGTVLLALNGRRAGWGFVAYLASNAAWIGFAWIHGRLGEVVLERPHYDAVCRGEYARTNQTRPTVNTTFLRRAA